VNRVHQRGQQVYESSLNETRSSVDLRPRFNQLNRYASGQRGGAMANHAGASGVAATEPISRWGLVLRGRHRMTYRPKGVSGVDGNWKVACNSGWVALERRQRHELTMVVLQWRDKVRQQRRDPLFDDNGLAASGIAHSSTVAVT
jgi:hypothetical protein